MPVSQPQRLALPNEQERLTRDVLGRWQGKWSPGVLCVLAEAEGPIRFTRMLDSVAEITQKVLTTTLRHLERDGS